MLYLVEPCPVLRPIIVMVAFHTRTWLKMSLPHFQATLPHSNFLVVDNNVAGSAESRWLKTRDVMVLKTDGGLSHGHCMNLAANYAWRMGYNVMVHIEPDCLSQGRAWYDSLLNAISDGYWMASATRTMFGELHPTPSAWRLDVAYWLDFLHRPRSDDSKVASVIKDLNLTGELSLLWHQDWLDTAIWAFYRCKLKSIWVPCPDFTHYWRGSQHYNPFQTDFRVF